MKIPPQDKISKLNSDTFKFNIGKKDDIELLESLRIRSIENCKYYTKEQLGIWKSSTPDWTNIINNTIVCNYKKELSGLVSIRDNELYLLYVDPLFQKHRIGDKLVSIVETQGMVCDTNSNSERLLKKRGWIFSSDNIKEIRGQVFKNKWYTFNG